VIRRVGLCASKYEWKIGSGESENWTFHLYHDSLGNPKTDSAPYKGP